VGVALMRTARRSRGSGSRWARPACSRLSINRVAAAREMRSMLARSLARCGPRITRTCSAARSRSPAVSCVTPETIPTVRAAAMAWSSSSVAGNCDELARSGDDSTGRFLSPSKATAYAGCRKRQACSRSVMNEVARWSCDGAPICCTRCPRRQHAISSASSAYERLSDRGQLKRAVFEASMSPQG